MSKKTAKQPDTKGTVRVRPDGTRIECVRILAAHECRRCPACGEAWCARCRMHYAECACVGPHNAERMGWTLVARGGELFGERAV